MKSNRRGPNRDQSKLFTIHNHDGNPHASATEYFPELAPKSDGGDGQYFGTPAEEGWKKLKGLRFLDAYMGDPKVASLLNLYCMTEDHPSFQRQVASGNTYKAESVRTELDRRLLEICGHCALRGTDDCKLDRSDPTSFVKKYPTKADRKILIDLNEADPRTPC